MDAYDEVVPWDAQPLIGRVRELDEVLTAVDGAAAGAGAFVLLAGEPGIGKTRLLEAIAEQANARDCRVVTARCWDSQGAAPLGLWNDVLTAIAAEAPPTRVDLSPIDWSPHTGLLGDVDTSGARARLFSRIGAAVRVAAADRPLVLLLDDVQRADRSSLDVLGLLAAHCVTTNVAVVAAYRDTEMTSSLETFLTGLSCDALPIVLGPMDPADVAAMVRTLTDDMVDDDLATLMARTAGNPFLVREVVRAGAIDQTMIPMGVRHVLQRRVDGLSPACRATLSAAAITGGQFDVTFVAMVTGDDPRTVAEHVDEAVAGRIVVEATENRHAFVHDLFRSILAEMPGRAERRRIHHATGKAIERRFAGEIPLRAGELAHHFLAAVPEADPATAAAYGRLAGERAAGLFAYHDAVDYFQRALDVHTGAPASDRLATMTALGDALWRAGELVSARDVLAEAATLARVHGDAAALGHAALAFGCGHGGNQPLASADRVLISMITDALDALPDDDTALRCRLLSRLAVELYLTDERERRAETSDAAVAMARRLGDDSCLAGALYAQQMAMLGPGGLPERIAAIEEILGLAARSGDLELALWGHLFQVWVLTAQCLPTAQELALCEQLADELGLDGYRAEVALRQAINAFVAGDFDRVDELMTTVTAGATTELAAGSSRAALVALDYALRGPYDELAALVHGLLADQPDKVMWQAALLTVLIELDQTEEARCRLDDLAATGFVIPRDGLWLNAMYCLGCACFAAERGEHAERLRELLSPYADQAPVGAFGSMMTPLGLIEAAAGNFDEALRLLDGAMERDRRTGNHAYALFTQRERAAVLLARDHRGDRQHAAQLLTDARAELERRGFTGLVARTQRLLDAATRPASVTSAGRPPRIELRREGAAWLARFADRTTCLPATKGVDDLATLIAQPGTEIAATYLAGAPLSGDTGPVLDEVAKRQFKARLMEIDDDLAEAEGNCDLGRAERMRDERDHLVGALTSAFGLGGRPRRTGDTRERARQAVTWRIRHAIKTVGTIDPDLATHLDASVRTGTYCVYEP